MTVIVSYITERYGFVASDGRCHSSVLLDNQGRANASSVIVDDSFDKTFAIPDKKVVGAFASLVEFEGKTVGEHIVEISSAIQVDSFSDWLAAIEHTLCERLQSIDVEENIAFASRKVELLIVARSHLRTGRMTSAQMILSPQEASIRCHTETKEATSRGFYRALGSSAAAHAAALSLQMQATKKETAESISRAITRAVNVGISDADIHPHGTENDCGGQIFVRNIDKLSAPKGRSLTVKQ